MTTVYVTTALFLGNLAEVVALVIVVTWFFGMVGLIGLLVYRLLRLLP